MDLSKFMMACISATVAVVIVASVALPTISGVEIASTVENADAIKSMLGLIPLLLVIAIVIACVTMAVKRNN